MNYPHNKIFYNDLTSLINIKKIIDKYLPNIIHSASPKANLLSLILSKFFKEIKFVISFSGLGFMFTNKNPSFFFKLKKFFYIEILKFLIINSKNVHLIMQNTDDYVYFKKIFKLQKSKIHLIKGGSGINLNKFKNKKNY